MRATAAISPPGLMRADRPAAPAISSDRICARPYICGGAGGTGAHTDPAWPIGAGNAAVQDLAGSGRPGGRAALRRLDPCGSARRLPRPPTSSAGHARRTAVPLDTLGCDQPARVDSVDRAGISARLDGWDYGGDSGDGAARRFTPSAITEPGQPTRGRTFSLPPTKRLIARGHDLPIGAHADRT